MSLEYLPVVLESIKSDAFPPVAVFLRQGSRYILYKDREVDLTRSALVSLRESRVSHVFVRAADCDALHSYFEEHLESIFLGDSVSLAGKNLVLCSTMVNYISEAYQSPHLATPFHNCRRLLKRFQLCVADRQELLTLLECAAQSGVYLFTHCAQMAILAMAMYQKLFNASHGEQVEVGLGAMLHDIGMLNVSHNIVSKCDALDSSEYYRVKEHVRDGYRIAQERGITETTALDIILRHHERFDGRGYPGSLSHYEIPRSAQVAGICDVFSALTNDRPYREASTITEALETMRSEAKLFNPQFFSFFEEMVSN